MPSCVHHSPDKQIFSHLELSILYTFQNCILHLLGFVAMQIASHSCHLDLRHWALPWCWRTSPIPLFSRSSPVLLLFWMLASETGQHRLWGTSPFLQTCQSCIQYSSRDLLPPSGHIIFLTQSWNPWTPTYWWCEDKYYRALELKYYLAWWESRSKAHLNVTFTKSWEKENAHHLCNQFELY